ncbi:Cas8a1 family CRISPR/Cas system-associated protein [Aneurinibacillus thermoaerophilus]|uniref:CRISPR-associated protein Cst1 n=1 Tax=Aneurinibacillus thermoaerophilus TaxID=143495 RepID=A0A1G8F234_ANETH|nr:Cas8a1 family CRISPR/Cas system-associated protein [Aneurinibacillus thermoaerophilus]MED0675079.1 Cas8a1 family CRISPR/Cas system-associated protein [Aneurinibacillus thermoaerophilus]MED0677867.1 Cas8a1 family CRISPR/Cas system-associated protein [Aneurinibacillus thermoaerophilus]MED0756528.1 Cas8a1 family CRISPR/Cas system-associated protein [Aneurinibacillus thermoaerophilus]MED0761558.1 Cas8a1 family CRISPR/Cas system-associated protein [Aneurinibacillus thermoaerophilus]MED0764427.1 
MVLRLYASDWLMSMALVGLQRLYIYGEKHNIIPDEHRGTVRETDSGLEIEPVALGYLPQIFFSYLIDEYSVAERDYERLKNNLKYGKNKERFSDALASIKKTIADSTKKILKYFTDTPAEAALQDIQNRLKEIKHHDQLEELQVCIHDYYNVVKQKEINDKLTLNYFKSVILSPFFGQPSFLNVAKNSLDLSGHIDLFYKDYVLPVQNDIQLLEVINKTETGEDVLAFLDEHADYSPFRTLKKAWKKKDIIFIRNYMKEEVPECTLAAGQPAFQNFEEMMFSPLGVSSKNAANFFWDLEKNRALPISSLAKLVLFCVPLGATMYYRKDGFDDQGEVRLYAGFVHTDEKFKEIFQKNEHFKQLKKQSQSFEKIVSRLVRGIRKESEYIMQHLFFLEMSANYQSKRTLLDYYHIPHYLAKYFQEYGEKLEHISPYEYREHFIRNALQGMDTKHVIFKYLRHVIKKGGSGLGVYIAVRERHRIECYKRGEKDMKKQDNRVAAFFNSGRDIRKAFEQAGKARESEDTYSASAGKKVAGIAYRLLNATKANNKDSFMDTLLRVYMSVDKPVPTVFLHAMHEREMDFTTAANAFIAGMLSSENEKQKDREEASV